jgi:hypothetical protein
MNNGHFDKKMFSDQEHVLITKQSQNCHNQPPCEGDKKFISTFLSEHENFALHLLDLKPKICG